ncbi:MAG: hypothetical protein AB1598_12425 [Thermodesulfobacteriota bacterium]
MNPKRFALRSILLAFLLFVTGCVYLRLYKVQNQLNDFDSNFELSDKGGLILIFLNPVLEAGDMVWLMKNGPLKKEENGEGELWTYIFEKQYLTGDREGHEYDIPILILMQNEMVKEIIFPERFLKYISIPLLKKMFSSMGEAEINKLSKSASSIFRGSNPDEIPGMENIVDTLGKPYSIEEKDDAIQYTYLYYLKNGALGPVSDYFEFETEFTFNKESKALEKARGTIRGLTMTLDFTSE